MAAIIGAALSFALTSTAASYGAKYLEKAISGDSDAYLAETKRHNLATEKYNKDYNEWSEHRQKALDFIAKQKELDTEARHDLAMTDENLALYAEYHEDITREPPKFSDYYQPSETRKMYQYICLAGGGVLSVYLKKKFI